MKQIGEYMRGYKWDFIQLLRNFIESIGKFVSDQKWFLLQERKKFCMKLNDYL